MNMQTADQLRERLCAHFQAGSPATFLTALIQADREQYREELVEALSETQNMYAICANERAQFRDAVGRLAQEVGVLRERLRAAAPDERIP